MWTPVEIATALTGGLVAATRIVKAAQPLWDKIPSQWRWLPPVLVVALPEAAMKLAGVQTGMDLTEALIVTLTLVVPGAPSSAHKELVKNHEVLKADYDEAVSELESLKVQVKS